MEALLHSLKRIKLSNLTIHCIEAQVFISKINASVSHVYAYEAEGLPLNIFTISTFTISTFP